MLHTGGFVIGPSASLVIWSPLKIIALYTQHTSEVLAWNEALKYLKCSHRQAATALAALAWFAASPFVVRADAACCVTVSTCKPHRY